MRIAAAVAAALLALAAPRPAAAVDPAEPGPWMPLDVVTAGVRCDAPPFSFVTGGDCPVGPVAADRVKGFMVDLCRVVFERLGYPLRFRVVTAEERFAALSRRDGEGVDVLCEPTTVTRARLEQPWHFSQIVFVAGISYLSLPQKAGGSEASSGVAVAALAGTTALDLLPQLAAQGVFNLRRGEWYTATPVASHTEGIDKACRGDARFYVGDRDILRRLTEPRPECQAVLSDLFFSQEPYAIAVAAEYPALALAVQEQVYGIFADGTYERLLAEAFPGRRTGLLIDQLLSLYTLPPGTPPGRPTGE